MEVYGFCENKCKQEVYTKEETNTFLNDKIDKTINWSGDLNDIKDTGFYYCNNSTNSPTGGNGYLFTQKCSDSYLYQRFVDPGAEHSYERAKIDGVWGNWVKTGIKTTELTIENYLTNDWSPNGGCHIIKDRNMVHFQLSVRNGTNTLIMQLPTDFRPKSTILIPAIGIGSTFGYIQIDNYGQVSCSSGLVGASIVATCSFVVN
jgi:hypothetical protein